MSGDASSAGAPAGPGSPYDAFAADYHWIVPDEQLSGERFLRLYAAVLEQLPEGAVVLDCACGPGFDVLALARAGFVVAASDASAGMVDTARQLLVSAGLDVPVARCRWDQLPHVLAARFDAVFCIGNSISHCQNDAAMAEALLGMRGVLRPGGLLVVEARDWERLRAERQRFEVREHVALRGDARGICLYVWTIPDSWDEPHRAEIVVLVERNGTLQHHSVALTFSPFRQEDLLGRMARAGLEVVGVRDSLPGRYVVTAHAPRP